MNGSNQHKIEKRTKISDDSIAQNSAMQSRKPIRVVGGQHPAAGNIQRIEEHKRLSAFGGNQ